MNYNVDINSDNRATKFSSDYYIRDFTLTVKAVNYAPIVLHPLEESHLSWDAAMVLNPV